MKKVISLALVLMLVLSLAVSASAATVVNDTTHAYKAYQVFSGTQNPADANLGHPEWGTGVNGAELLSALKTDSVTTAYFATCNSAEDVAGVLAKADTPSYVIGMFAQLAYNYKTATATDIAASATSVTLDAGYYLIVDVTTPGEGDAKNPALLQVTNAGPIYIQKKYDAPEADKNVIADDHGDSVDHVKKEDAGLGVPVEFHLNAEMPSNLYGYKKYPITFHDSLTSGLTLDASSIKLYLDDSATPVDSSLYTVTVGGALCDKHDPAHPCTFHVSVPDALLIPGFTPGCELKVKYTATPNDDALVIEYNNYRLEYANDPDWTEGNPLIPTPPTGVTPWHEVEVHHTSVQIRKVDGASDQPLTGAGFTITGTSEQKVRIVKNQFTAYASDATVDPNNKYWKLLDGTYTKWDPTLPETDVSVYEPAVGGVYTLYYAETVVDYVTDYEVVNYEAFVGADGTVTFAGLGEGTYQVEETTVPAGYNGLKEKMTLIVTFHESTGQWEYSWSGGATGTTPSIQIDNLKGSILPETGGIGTTVFYVIGGLMAAAATVLLVTKKRVSAE